MTPMQGLVERYQKLYAGLVYDALYYDCTYRNRFVLDRGIHAMGGPLPVVGPAFTCWGTRPTAFVQTQDEVEHLDSARFGIFESIMPGEVVVMDTDRDRTVAHFGDVTALMLKAAHAAGVVIDGYTRDTSRVHAVGFPVFARGSQPQDAYGKWGLLKCGGPIGIQTTGGSLVVIGPGDWIFGDADGVLVIPKRLAEEVCTLAEKRKECEDEIRAALHSGDTPSEVFQKFGRW